MDIVKTLDTLRRQAEKKVEDKQREMADLNRVIEKMEARKLELNQRIAIEQDAAFKANDAYLMRQAQIFRKKAERELQEIAEATADAERIMEQKRNELTELYAEQKRFEILLENKQEAARKAKQKKEQNELDEVAGVRRSRHLE